jgi:hypothetical protein
MSRFFRKNIQKVFAHDLGRSIRKDLEHPLSLTAQIRKEMTRSPGYGVNSDFACAPLAA